MTRSEAVALVLEGRTPRPRPEGHGSALVNIALCKYWGKRDEELNLPITSSLSVSLPGLSAHTVVRPSETPSFSVNGDAMPTDSKAARRVFNYVKLFTDEPLSVETVSTVPLGAGLASSASGFAALARALDALFGWELGARELSILARMGSGSASRSIYEGFVLWHAGERPDGMDSYAEPLPPAWPSLRIGVVLVSAQAKSIGSREAMQRTVATSELYRSWPGKASSDLAAIQRAINVQDFPALGRHVESNALAMHATMMDSWPPVIYWREETVAALRSIHAARSEGLEVYATMDAGPNVKLLFLEESEDAVRRIFPGLRVMAPFA